MKSKKKMSMIGKGKSQNQNVLNQKSAIIALISHPYPWISQSIPTLFDTEGIKPSNVLVNIYNGRTKEKKNNSTHINHHLTKCMNFNQKWEYFIAKS